MGHVEICLKDLRDEYAQCEFIVSDPVVSYRETVNETSSQTCLAKSPNKHNRIYLTAKPTLQEPVFLVEITCPQDAMSGVYSCLNMRRGCVVEENPREGTPLVQARAYLPVSESFGFVAALRQQTSGQAFPQCVFDHWENMPGDPLTEGSKMADLILAVR